mmetsp:Transcript_3158/g.12915  ORF Transcript_3158/g.12915 Transcript_3158/m.12915 type:complete len:257 (+) Transcript_3158:1864-2634(+)
MTRHRLEEDGRAVLQARRLERESRRGQPLGHRLPPRPPLKVRVPDGVDHPGPDLVLVRLVERLILLLPQVLVVVVEVVVRVALLALVVLPGFLRRRSRFHLLRRHKLNLLHGVESILQLEEQMRDVLVRLRGACPALERTPVLRIGVGLGIGRSRRRILRRLFGPPGANRRLRVCAESLHEPSRGGEGVLLARGGGGALAGLALGVTARGAARGVRGGVLALPGLPSELRVDGVDAALELLLELALANAPVVERVH